VILTLGRWAARSPDHDPTLPLSPVSMMLSLRAMFDPAKAGDALVSIVFRFGEISFRVCVADGVLTVERTALEEACAVIEATPEAVAAVIYSEPAQTAALARELLRIEGDEAVFLRFTGWFELPAKAERPDS